MPGSLGGRTGTVNHEGEEMARRTWTKLAAAALLLATVGWRDGNARTDPTGRLVTVKFVDVNASTFKFEPSTVTVRRGDTLRFLQVSAMPHNVEFTEAPRIENLGAARVGPYVITRQQKYDLVIDGRFIAGRYAFQCTPHASLGMVGALIVSESK